MTNTTLHFPCTKCGACCRHVNLSPLTAYLDRGDGICYHHNTTEHTCTIYTKRPEICRVDVYFEKHYQTQIAWDDFVKINLIACKQLNDLDV